MKLLREPLLHFLLVGAVIYVFIELYVGLAAEETDNTIVVGADEIAWLETSWQQRWNRPPTAKEREGLINAHIREIVLHREALAMGLDEVDVVIRRRLVQKLELLVQDLGALVPPTAEQLQAYFAAHRQRYQDPVLFTITQVFIDPDKRGDATLDDAEAIKATLMAQADPGANVAALGDSFMLQSYYPQKSQADIQRLFGSGFAESVAELSPAQWHGPVLSGYGVHLVYVHSRTESLPPELSQVRDRVAQDWEGDRRQEIKEQYLANLLKKYTVIVEDGTPPASPVSRSGEASE